MTRPHINLGIDDRFLFAVSLLLALLIGCEVPLPPNPPEPPPPVVPLDNLSAFDVRGTTAQVATIRAALSRCRFDFRRLVPGLKSTTGRAKINVSFGPMSAGTGGWASTDGSIKINQAMSDTSQQSVFLMETAHAVDFFLMTDQHRKKIYDIFHPAGRDGHSWFEPSTYFNQVGEAYTTAFVWAFSDLRPNPKNYTHATTTQVADQLVVIFGQNPNLPVPR